MAEPPRKLNLDPFRVLAVVLALATLPFFGRLAEFGVRAEMADLLSGDKRSLSGYESVTRRIGQVDDQLVFVLVVIEFDDVFTPRSIAQLRKITRACLDSPDIYHAISLVYPPFRPAIDLGAIPPLIMKPLIENDTPTKLEAARKLCQEDFTILRNFLVSADSRRALLWLMSAPDLASPATQEKFCDSINATLAPFRQAGLQFKVLSFPHGEEEIRTTLAGDLRVFIPTALGLLLIVLLITFRFSPRMLAYVLANQIAGLALLPGLVNLLDREGNVFTVMLFPLLTGIHLTLLAHVGTAFQRAWRAGRAPEDSLRSVFSEVFKSSAFAALTTAVGLFSLGWSEVPQIREFGLLGGLGVTALFLLTFGPGLLVLVLLHPRARPAAVAAPDTNVGMESWTHHLQRRRGFVLGAALIAAVAAIAGWGLVRTDIRATEFLQPASPLRQAVEECDQHCGGINVLRIEIDSGKPNGLRNAKFMEYLRQVHAMAERRPEIAIAYSYPVLADQIRHVALADLSGLTRRLAEGITQPALLLNLLNTPQFKQTLPLLDLLFDSEFRRSYLAIRTKFMPAGQYIKVLRGLVDEMNAARPKDLEITVSAQQGIHELLEADRLIVRSQVKTAGLTCGVIAIVLLVLWRSLPLVLLAVLANAIPVGLVVALQGYADVPLNSVTIMIAAVAFGIAVDDTIHFITHWRGERSRGLGEREAVRATLRVKGRPIVCTTVILSGIVGVFWLSSFPPVVHFGLLSAIGFIGALIVALVLLPAALLTRD